MLKGLIAPNFSDAVVRAKSPPRIKRDGMGKANFYTSKHPKYTHPFICPRTKKSKSAYFLKSLTCNWQWLDFSEISQVVSWATKSCTAGGNPPASAASPQDAHVAAIQLSDFLRCRFCLPAIIVVWLEFTRNRKRRPLLLKHASLVFQSSFLFLHRTAIPPTTHDIFAQHPFLFLLTPYLSWEQSEHHNVTVLACQHS